MVLGSSSHGGERKWQGTSHDTPVSGDHMWVGPGMGGTRGGALTMGILQQLAQALQRAGQPAAYVPQRSAIERMARYRPIDFLGKKEDKPSMA